MIVLQSSLNHTLHNTMKRCGCWRDSSSHVPQKIHCGISSPLQEEELNRLTAAFSLISGEQEAQVSFCSKGCPELTTLKFWSIMQFLHCIQHMVCATRCETIEILMNSLYLSFWGPQAFRDGWSVKYSWMKMTPGNWILLYRCVYYTAK